MMQRRHWIAAAALAAALVAGCGRKAPAPPSGEVRSALAGPTLDGRAFDPATLSDKLALVTFWSPS